MAARNFKIGLLAFIVGVGLASFYWPGYTIMLGALLFGVLLVIPKEVRVIGLIIICLILGLFRYHTIPIPDLSAYYDQDIEQEVVISSQPDRRMNGQRLTVKSDQLGTNLLVTAPLYPAYSYGDRLRLSGYMQEVTNFAEFDYKGYLERYGIYGVFYRPRIEKIGQDQSLKKIVLDWKSNVTKRISQYLPEPGASLLKAILLADKGTVPNDIKENFSRAGTSHIIAISGMHITIISGLIFNLWLLIGLNRRQSFWAASLILLVYLVIIGWPASAVRATVMGFLVMWAMYLGRLNSSLNALLLTAATMLLINPRLLRNDIGFQLSFTAVIGLVYGKSWFDKLLTKLPNRLQIKEAIAMTLAAQLTTWPLVVYYFDKFSLVAPLANILVVPVLPFLLILGLGSVVLSFIIPVLALITFSILSVLLKYIINIVEVLSGLPHAYLEINGFQPQYLVIAYLLIFVLLWLIRNKQNVQQV